MSEDKKGTLAQKRKSRGNTSDTTDEKKKRKKKAPLLGGGESDFNVLIRKMRIGRACQKRRAGEWGKTRPFEELEAKKKKNVLVWRLDHVIGLRKGGEALKRKGGKRESRAAPKGSRATRLQKEKKKT